MVRFDVTQPNYVETNVQKAVPTSGADAAVYDAWAKVGQQASSAFIDIYDKREEAAATNYTRQSEGESIRTLSQYHEQLQKQSVDGYIGGKSVSDLMLDKTKQLGDIVVNQAPTSRAKSYSAKNLQPIFAKAVMDSDRLFTTKVAEGSVRRLGEAEKNLVLSINPDTDWNSVSGVINQATITSSMETGNIDESKLSEFVPKITKDSFDRMKTFAMVSTDKNKLSDTGINLVGQQAHDLIMSTYKGKAIAVKQGDKFMEYNPATKELQESSVKPKDTSAAFIDADTGETLMSYEDMKNSTAFGRAFNPDEYDTRVKEIYSSLKKKTEVSNTIHSNRVADYVKALSVSPEEIKKDATVAQGRNLLLSTINADDEVAKKHSEIKSILEAEAKANTMNNLDMTVAVNTMPKEAIQNYVRKSLDKSYDPIIESLRSNGQEELANELLITKNQSLSRLAEETKNDFYAAQLKYQADLAADPVGIINEKEHPNLVNSARTTVLNFGKKTEDIIQEFQENPKALASVQNYFATLDQSMETKTNGAIAVLSNADVESFKKYLNPRNSTSSDVATRIDAMRVSMNGDSGVVTALTQVGSPEYSVGLMIENPATKIKFFDAMRQQGEFSKDLNVEDAKTLDESIKSHADFATIRGELSKLGGATYKETENNLIRAMRNMSLSIKQTSPDSTDEEVVAQVYKELFPDRTTFSGRFKFSYDAKQITSDEAATIDNHMYNLLESVSIVVPKGVTDMEGMSPLDQEIRYKESLKKSAFVSPIGSSKYGFFKEETVAGIKQITPIYYKDSTTGKFQQLTMSTSDIKSQHAKLQQVIEADNAANKQVFGSFFGSIVNKKNKFFDVVPERANKAVGLNASKVALGSKDSKYVKYTLDSEIDQGYIQKLKSEGYPTGMHPKYGELVLKPYTVNGAPQLHGGLLLKNNSVLMKDPDYRRFVKDGYTFKSGTNDGNALKMGRWIDMRIDEMSDLGIKKAAAVGVPMGSITPNQMLIIQAIAYKEGQDNAFTKETTPLIIESINKNDSGLLAKAMMKYSSNFVSNGQLNNNAKKLLGMFYK